MGSNGRERVECDDPLKQNTQQSIGVKWKREGSTTVKVMTVHPNQYKEVEQKAHEQYLPIRRLSKRHEAREGLNLVC